MENLDENLDQTPKSMKEKRGSFLLVLCILSFITIGFGAISVLTNYLRGPESLIESLEAFDIVEEENVFSAFGKLGKFGIKQNYGATVRYGMIGLAIDYFPGSFKFEYETSEGGGDVQSGKEKFKNNMFQIKLSLTL